MHFKFKITGHCHLLLHQIPLWKGLFTLSLSPNKISKSTVLHVLKDLNDHYTNSTTLMLTHFNLMQCWASLLQNWTNIHISFIWKFYIVLIIYERRKRSTNTYTCSSISYRPTQWFIKGVLGVKSWGSLSIFFGCQKICNRDLHT